MTATLADLRRAALRRAFVAPAPLAAAVARLGFVQADPIRAPARAQDLILRHRVVRYRAGDLERRYPALGLDEDYFYAYGFMPRATWALLHPRGPAPHESQGLAREVLAFVREAGPTHPRALLAAFGDRRERNAWGGQSLATTRALEHLQYWGLLRVARRERGVRVYEAAPPPGPPLPEAERARRLVLLVAAVFAPAPEASLRAVVREVLRRTVPHWDGRRTAVADLARVGALAHATVDGVRYLWPAEGAADGAPSRGAPRRVRLLAPFDPVVWDRRRFEHLWGWAYRFEAYTPVARRERGYYALPVLWGERMVGWATVAAGEGALDVGLGFVGGRPRGRAFERGLEAEVERIRRFLGGV